MTRPALEDRLQRAWRDDDRLAHLLRFAVPRAAA